MRKRQRTTTETHPIKPDPCLNIVNLRCRLEQEGQIKPWVKGQQSPGPPGTQERIHAERE